MKKDKLVKIVCTLFFFLLFLFTPVHRVHAAVGTPNGILECQFKGTFTSPTQYSYDPSVLINKNALPACESVDTGSFGFQIPSLGDILTFAIRAFFAIAGIAALFYLLLGGFGWVTSGGDKDAITAAREKIQAAVIGMLIIVAVLAIIWTLEQIIFKRRICFGLSCPVTLPGLIETTGGKNCCVCIKDDGSVGELVNTFVYKCGADGKRVKL